MGLFLQQASVNYFKSMCRDIWERFLSNKICIFDSSNEYTWFILNIMLNTPAFQHVHWKLNMSYYMYSILSQVAQSSHQLIKDLTWKDDHNRRLFTIFRKLKTWQEKGITYAGEKRYSEDALVQASEYFILSQSTYNHLKARLSGTQYFYDH